MIAHRAARAGAPVEVPARRVTVEPHRPSRLPERATAGSTCAATSAAGRVPTSARSPATSVSGSAAAATYMPCGARRRRACSVDEAMTPERLEELAAAGRLREAHPAGRAAPPPAGAAARRRGRRSLPAWLGVPMRGTPGDRPARGVRRWRAARDRRVARRRPRASNRDRTAPAHRERSPCSIPAHRGPAADRSRGGHAGRLRRRAPRSSGHPRGDPRARPRAGDEQPGPRLRPATRTEVLRPGTRPCHGSRHCAATWRRIGGRRHRPSRSRSASTRRCASSDARGVPRGARARRSIWWPGHVRGSAFGRDRGGTPARMQRSRRGAWLHGRSCRAGRGRRRPGLLDPRPRGDRRRRRGDAARRLASRRTWRGSS